MKNTEAYRGEDVLPDLPHPGSSNDNILAQV